MRLKELRNHCCTCLPDIHRHKNTRMKQMQLLFEFALVGQVHDKFLQRLETNCFLKLRKINLKPGLQK